MAVEIFIVRTERGGSANYALASLATPRIILLTPLLYMSILDDRISCVPVKKLVLVEARR